MTLQELGQSIREKREAAGLTIDDVAARIKISTRILKSIEEGSLVGLPHAVYTKSFIRSFGLLVGYDPEELNARLETLFPPESLDETRAEPTFRNQTPMSYPSAGRRFAALLVMLLILVGLIGGGWYVTVNYGDAILEVIKKPFSAISAPAEGNGQEKPPAAGSATTSETLSNTLSVLVGSSARQQTKTDATRTVAPPASPSLAIAAPPVGGAGLPGLPTDASAVESPASAGVAASGAENVSGEGISSIEASSGRASLREPSSEGSSPAPSDAGSSAEDAVSSALQQLSSTSTPNGGNRVVLTAREACWVGPRADGSKGRDFILQPGESFAFTYNNSLELTLGNAGGVTVQHNGQNQDSPGRRGQRVVLRFPSRPN